MAVRGGRRGSGGTPAVYPTIQVLDPVILAPRPTSLLLHWQSESHGQLSLQAGGKCVSPGTWTEQSYLRATPMTPTAGALPPPPGWL